MAFDPSSSLLGMLGMGSAASPIAAAGMLGGLAATAYGGFEAYQGAKKQFGISQEMVGLEVQAEAQRKQMMELNAQRLSLQTVRNAQRQRALATSTATGQGAQFGSGLAGGYGQISGEAGVGLLGISQQLQAGENLFGINAQLMQKRAEYAAAGSQTYTGTSIAGFGQQAGGALRSFGQPLLFSGT